ncbi:hypothetical protein BDZ89DRAFT_263143 [Hymenopellis radicata]|nr:hypothetical protein BDZ89DRAFT_263143 [Hymenopellis radicata]
MTDMTFIRTPGSSSQRFTLRPPRKLNRAGPSAEKIEPPRMDRRQTNSKEAMPPTRVDTFAFQLARSPTHPVVCRFHVFLQIPRRLSPKFDTD